MDNIISPTEKTGSSASHHGTQGQNPFACERGESSENGALLGTMTKSCATPDFKGLSFDFDAARSSALRRAEKFALQNHACELLPNERVCKCLKMRINRGKPVGIRYNENRGKAHYDNLQRCGSIWLCPVCAQQISEGRRKELQLATSKFYKKDRGFIYLLTLTNPHHHGDNLKQLLEGQKKALHRFWTLRKSRTLFESLGKVGHIIATEATYGKNGWHPHYHILLFFSQPINSKAVKAYLATCWQNCCKLSGLKVPSIEHGCDLRDGKYADQYVGKWGLEDEVTKGHTKKGREGSETPWDLLRQSEGGCERSGYLFKQYADAFKGKRQLSWSKGLKELLLVNEVTDEELATETEKDSIEIKQLHREIFRLIIKYKLRASVLRAAELDMTDGYSRLDDLIMEIAIRETKENLPRLLREANLFAKCDDDLEALEVSHV